MDMQTFLASFLSVSMFTVLSDGIEGLALSSKPHFFHKFSI